MITYVNIIVSYFPTFYLNENCSHFFVLLQNYNATFYPAEPNFSILILIQHF